jgi:phage shock protein PspC (stress-responsive transcriptional regulator)
MPNLFTRDDTLLGVCQGVGEEFGFNANYLRVAMGAGLLWNPVAVLAIYAALGLALMIARWIWPVRRAAADAAAPEREAPVAGNDAAPVTLADAA